MARSGQWNGRRKGIRTRAGGFIPFEERLKTFHSLVAKAGPDECWEWCGGITLKGYGMFHCEGKEILAHRFAFLIANGSLSRLFVCHKCDNPKCCNPAHLFQGTNRDNVMDCVSKIRHANGSVHPMAKLTNAQAMEVQKSTEPTKVLAARYNVSKHFISRVRKGERYKHEQHLCQD